MIDDDAAVLKSIKGSTSSSPLPVVDWAERCIQLELSLQRSKSHSGKVRQALLDKIVRLERRASKAETKVSEAEAQVEALTRAQAMDTRPPRNSSSRCPSPSPEPASTTTTTTSSHPLQDVVEKKEKMISQLESELEQQKKLRLHDAKQVEEKAAKIKEWVATKLKELEDQNETLREENRKCGERLISLEDRLIGASPETRRKIESEISSIKRAKPGMTTSSSTAMTGLSTAEPGYAVVDPRRKAKALGYRSPKRFPRKDFVPMSSSSDDEDNYDGIFRNRSSPTARKPVPPPRSRGVNAGAVTYANIPGTPQLSKRRTPGGEAKSARGGSLDRKLADMKKLNFGEIREKRKQAIATAANELGHDHYSEVHSPNKTTQLLPTEQTQFEPIKPPTPPLHRCPSWESRIYKVASTSINSATTTPTHSIRSNFRHNHHYAEQARNSLSQPANDKQSAAGGLRLSHVFEPNIPVYATVQGKASQIRSVPFSGDSSDSSDNETDGGRVTTTTTATSSTSGDGSSHELYATPVRGRVRRGISVESALSDDYDIPPDAISTMASNDRSCPKGELRTPRRFSSLRREPPSHFRQEVLEKSGYLTKLGGKLKTWSRRWFVLKNGSLSYYKSQSDAIRGKPREQIKLDENCRVMTTEGSAAFQISVINKKKEKIYYLAAESREIQSSWCKVLQEVLRRHSAGFTSCLNSKPTVEGWVVKVKHGHSKKVWCVLVSKSFLYFRSQSEVNPLGCVNMRNMKVEEVTSQSDSDNDDHAAQNSETESCSRRDSTESASSSPAKYTIALLSKYDGSPVYLLLASKQDFDAWLYHLTVVSSGDITGTPFEHAVSKLMQSDSPQSEVADIDSNPSWAEPLLHHTKESIVFPLTTLPTEELRNEAVQLFKSLQLFMSVPLDSAGIDYHVALVQNSLELCLSRTELQNELYSQLIKQTSSSPSVVRNLCSGAGSASNFFLCATQSLFTCDASSNEKTSPTGHGTYMPNLATIGANAKLALERNKKLPDFVFVQGFQMLALSIPLFLPTGRIMWLLKQHLRRCSDLKVDSGQYASYCLRALERSAANGLRKFRPSRMEVLGILLRNPYHHSLPHSVPVHFLNDTYLVVGFDGSSTVKQFTSLLNTQAGIRECSKSGFALFSDDPIDKTVEHLLEENAKLADIISRWELALRERRLGKFENTKVVRLYYKNRLYVKDQLREATDKEKLLLAYQVNVEVMAGRFPITQELTLELCALLAQIEYGNLRNFGDDILRKAIARFYPPHLLQMQHYNSIFGETRAKWRELENCSPGDCTRIYLNCARKWSLCGAQLFQAIALKPIKLKSSGYKSTLVACSTAVWLAVTDEAIAVLDVDTMHVLVQYPYRCIITFGGCREDFMIVVNNRTASEIDSGSASGSGGASSASDGSIRHEKMLFSMDKSKILQLTILIADYINTQPSASVTQLEKLSLSFDCSIEERLATTPVRCRAAPALSRSHTRI